MKKINLGFKIILVIFILSLSTIVFGNFLTELQAANFLARNGIIQDNSSNPSKYKLESEISRREMMKIVINLSGEDFDESCYGFFKDINKEDWGCKYVETAYKNDLIAENLNFRPDDFLTKAEALKLIFKANNIEKEGNDENWGKDYLDTAKKLKILSENEKEDLDKNASRGWIFVFAKSAFEYRELQEELEKELF